MNYLDVYFSRVNYFGETTAERIKNTGIVAFEKWLDQSPGTVTDLSVERGYYFSGIIETSKDKEEKKLMYLHVANDIPIVVGDILTWRQDNGVTEKWLLLQQIHKVHGTYKTFQIIKCNYDLKWIDADGYLHRSWAYAVSSVDSKVKGNFRMWHSLISPQPNKFAEIIMPRPVLEGTDVDELMRGINFIIENEGWVVIECDWTSVEGIVYMSLTESKVNYQYDDRDIDVADTDRYKFPILPSLYKVGEVIVPQFEAGTLNQWEIELRPSDFSLVSEDKELPGEEENWFQELHPTTAGMCMVTMRLKNRHAVTHEVEITINGPQVEPVYYIDGASEVKLDRYETYQLIDEETHQYMPLESDEVVVFTVTNITKEKIAMATLTPAYDKENNVITCAKVLHANAKNKIGEVLLTAEHRRIIDDEHYEVLSTYTKTVKIMPLW